MKQLQTILQAFCVLMCFINIVNAQQPLIVKTEIEGVLNTQVQDYKIYLYKFDTSKNDFVKFYQISKPDVKKVEVSPNNNYIAIIESEKILERNLSTLKKTYPYLNKRYINYYVNSLTIINSDGQVITKLNKDVQKIAWHPNGKIIAYITGSYSEDGSWGFRPEALYVFDVKTGKEKKIEGIRYPIVLQWIRGDGSNPLFIRDAYQIDGKRIVYKYNVQKEELTPTKHKNINFSPDGKYYLQYSGEEFDNFAVFETATDKEITAQLPTVLQRKFHWAFDTKHYAIQSENQQLYIYDVETKQIVETLEGKQVSPYESIKASSNIILMKDKTAYSVIKLKDDKIIKVTYPKIDTLKR